MPDSDEIDRIVDVLLVISDGTENYDDTDRPFSGRIDLAKGVFLEHLDGALNDSIMHACEPYGYDQNATRQFHSKFAFQVPVSISDFQNPQRGWDSKGVLLKSVALSRLIRDNAYNTEYAARIVYKVNGDNEIYPAHFDNKSELDTAFRISKFRGWLIDVEANELADLCEKYLDIEPHLPRRILRALFHTELAVHNFYIEVQYLLICSAIETLLNTSDDRPTKQFVERANQLSKKLDPSDVISKSKLSEWYSLRSHIAHSGGLPQVELDDRGRVEASSNVALGFQSLQSLARTTIRKAIEDPEFVSMFQNDETVNTAFPLTAAS